MTLGHWLSPRSSNEDVQAQHFGDRRYPTLTLGGIERRRESGDRHAARRDREDTQTEALLPGGPTSNAQTPKRS